MRKGGNALTFVHLHVYSSYSLLSSTAGIEQLVKNAKMKGFSAVALTDYNVMYGTFAFYKECMKQGIKPIVGLTVDVMSVLEEEKSYPLVLLAKNQAGYRNLLKISSAVQTKAKEGLPVKWLKAYSGGLIAFTPGLRGEIETNILRGNKEKALLCTERLKETFEEDSFFLAIQNHGLNEELQVMEEMVRISGKTGIGLIATNEVYYLEKEDSFAHECLLAIKHGKKLQDENREKLKNDEYYLKTASEMTDLFSAFPDALENTLKIAEQCRVELDMGKLNLPAYPVPDGLTADEFLEQLCRHGFRQRYGMDAPESYKERLSYELSVIKKMKFSDYFLIVWDFMRFAREKGILTGPGRGSAAGSLVAYCLFITDVDPMKHGLLFERFLNPERITMPDIDIDFPDNKRDDIIRYVVNKYGRHHVAQIITFGTLAARAVLRDVGRAFGLNAKEQDYLAKLVPSRLGITLREAYKESEGLRKYVAESPLNKKLFETACKLEGLPRHTSIHAAGVVISAEPLVHSVPIQEGHDDIFLTQYSMEHLEDAGLLKMDFLGLRNLTLIENIIESIYKHTGRKIDIKGIPLDDKKTYQLLSAGETTGVFQLESEGMRSVLKRLKPGRFEDIVAVNALYRPGPMENIPVFIRRKHGLEKVIYPHPALKPILENTYGVIVYQEQIMQIASTMAGFTLGEADLLRRAVGKKQKEILDKEREHFVAGSVKKGYDRKTANEIYDLIVKFANYGFNRSHAVAYSFIAYQLAYLKAHYPLYFMSCLLTSVIGNEKKIAEYIRELKEMGYSILPPSINKSGYGFLVENNQIRYSLAAIKGVGIAALREIFKARKSGNFQDLFDFCLRVPIKSVNRKTIEALVYSGSFDEFGVDRAVLLASIDVAVDHAQLVKPDGVDQGDLLFDLKPKYVEVEPLSIENKLRFEKEVLGFYLSAHPVSAFAEYFPRMGVRPLDRLKDSRFEKTAALIADIRKIRTRKGEAMAFLTLSDQSGEMDGVVFPKVYKRIMVLLQKGNILVFEGRVDVRRGKRQLVIENALDIKTAVKEMEEKRTLYLKIEKTMENREALHELKKILEECKGDTDVVLFYESSGKILRLKPEERVSPSESLLKKLSSLLGTQNVVLK